MKLFSYGVAACVALFLSGCVTQLKPDYTNFFVHQPHSILVVPPANKTTAVDAPAIFLTTVSEAFAERGYYVFPVFLVQDILNDLDEIDKKTFNEDGSAAETSAEAVSSRVLVFSVNAHMCVQ